MRKIGLILFLPLVLILLLANLTAAQNQIPTVTPAVGFLTPSPYVGFVTPSPAATPGCATPLTIPIGSWAYVSGGVYVRYQPSASSPWVNYYTESVTVRIVEGPVCDNLRYNWWRVRGPGNDGWVSEGLPGGYWLRLAEAPPGSTCATAAALTVGGRADLLRSLNVHDAPSESGLVITVAPNDAVVDVLEGPVCAGGSNWWRIRVTVVGVRYTGWVVDGIPGEAWMQAEGADQVSICAPPMNLAIGSQAYVNYDDDKPKNLRSAPSLNSELVASLLDGIGFEVIGGPVCADTYNWWQIQILSRPDVTGWLAEGGPAKYWISPQRDFNP